MYKINKRKKRRKQKGKGHAKKVRIGGVKEALIYVV